jgi:hypothetical protein
MIDFKLVFVLDRAVSIADVMHDLAVNISVQVVTHKPN